MRWKEDYVDPNAEFWRLDVACGWLPLREGAAAGLFDFALEMETQSEHGRRIAYASINSDLLGLVIERVATSRLADVVSAELWGPLGMQYEGDLLLDRRGMSVCDGGFCIALQDVGRIGQLFLNRGVAQGQQVVPEAFTGRMPAPQLDTVRANVGRRRLGRSFLPEPVVAARQSVLRVGDPRPNDRRRRQVRACRRLHDVVSGRERRG